VQWASASHSHTAAITSEGRLYTWGCGLAGQLGHGADAHLVTHPQLVRGLSSAGMRVTHVSCGPYHTAATTQQGLLFTWGCGLFGRLGHGDTVSVFTPRCVEALEPFYVTGVSCGWWHTAAVAVSRQPLNRSGGGRGGVSGGGGGVGGGVSGGGGLPPKGPPAATTPAPETAAVSEDVAPAASNGPTTCGSGPPPESVTDASSSIATQPTSTTTITTTAAPPSTTSPTAVDASTPLLSLADDSAAAAAAEDGTRRVSSSTAVDVSAGEGIGARHGGAAAALAPAVSRSSNSAINLSSDRWGIDNIRSECERARTATGRGW
jgi:hypothetical protein